MGSSKSLRTKNIAKIPVIFGLLLGLVSDVYSQNLELVYNNPEFFLKDIQFADSTLGFVVGSKGLILKSNDEGQSWIKMEANTAKTLLTVHVDKLHGTQIGGTDGQLFKTNNQTNWNLDPNIPSDFNASLNNVFFVHQFLGYASSSNGRIFRFNENGWEELENQFGETVLKFLLADGNLKVLLSNNKVASIEAGAIRFDHEYYSNITDFEYYNGYFYLLDRFNSRVIITNFSESEEKQLPVSGLKRINLIGDNIFLVAGADGNLFLTINGGETWINYNLPAESGNIESLSMIAPGIFGLVTSKGQIWRFKPDELSPENRPDELCDYQLSNIFLEVYPFSNVIVHLDDFNDFFQNDYVSEVISNSSKLSEVLLSNEFTVTFFVGEGSTVNQEILYEVCNDFCDNCETASIFIVNAELDIIQTNLITPNESGVNSSLRFNDDLVLENSEIWIYNRWGHEVYYMKNYDNNWNAEGLPGGVYYYVLKFRGYTLKKTMTVIK